MFLLFFFFHLLIRLILGFSNISKLPAKYISYNKVKKVLLEIYDIKKKSQ